MGKSICRMRQYRLAVQQTLFGGFGLYIYATKSAFISPNMSWSRVFRLPQIYKHVHHSSSGYRCSLDSSWLTRNFVGPNSTRNGWDFCYEFRGVMTRCESSVGSFGKCGQLTPCLDVRRQYATHAAREHKSKKMLLYLTGLVFAMVGCTYAAVPLYRRFCQATGYGGTVQRRESVEEKIARHAQDGTRTTSSQSLVLREIVVQFNADVADGMQWKFVPTQREVRVKPGESALAFYTAENQSSTPITGVSTYNVTPMKFKFVADANAVLIRSVKLCNFLSKMDLAAAVYFNKIQCFCFEEQRLLPGEQIDMPVFFYIDPEFETDPKMDGINNLILSYTFFKFAKSQSAIQSTASKGVVRSISPQHANKSPSLVATKLYLLERQKKQIEKLQKMIEEEEVKMLRKEMIPRAQLMPFFDRPFFPQRAQGSRLHHYLFSNTVSSSFLTKLLQIFHPHARNSLPVSTPPGPLPNTTRCALTRLSVAAHVNLTSALRAPSCYCEPHTISVILRRASVLLTCAASFADIIYAPVDIIASPSLYFAYFWQFHLFPGYFQRSGFTGALCFI
ncbi:hypothetical protein TEA_000232 [Camellia sinensis var. sinensis]|uniref:TPX2 C-terminal domain-containing protein n=1 Tax=Camellia sinensis var. sinensis TaxID=542762 RepID=A0A4S4DSW7_CAMSN|nr:hypothetical protein TEA_000232 [Camellia sinensis var. sinensis]